MGRPYYEVFEGDRFQLVEGLVVKVAEKSFTARISTEGFARGLEVVVPLVHTIGVPITAPLGKGIRRTLGGKVVKLEGDLTRKPKQGEKVLMRLLYVGTDGFRCLAWTYLKLAQCSEVMGELMLGEVTPNT